MLKILIKSLNILHSRLKTLHIKSKSKEVRLSKDFETFKTVLKTDVKGAADENARSSKVFFSFKLGYFKIRPLAERRLLGGCSFIAIKSIK